MVSPQSDDTLRKVFSVSELTGETRRLLEASYPAVWVEGELSRLSRPQSGHIYFNLKDAEAVLACAWFKNRQRGRDRDLRDKLNDGTQVLVCGKLTVYQPSGRFQMLVDHLEESGEGALLRAFEALKNKLKAQGFFASEHKKNLPQWPRRVGVITSPSGAAVRDVIATFTRRFPATRLRIYPVAVQGADAAQAIAQAIVRANRRADCEALIVCRGGGSLEDLWAFNEEIVAEAIFDSAIPIVSGVGHDVDFTIADFVADVRAPTPTAAAELLSTPDQFELAASLDRFVNRLERALRGDLERRGQRLDIATRRLVHPQQYVVRSRQQVTSLQRELALHMQNQLRGARLRIATVNQRLAEHSPRRKLALYRLRAGNLLERLRHLATQQRETRRTALTQLNRRLAVASPMATLERGYAIVEHVATGKVVTTRRQVGAGDKINARLADGRLSATIDAVDAVDGESNPPDDS